MKKISIRILLAIVGGALIWEGFRSGITSNRLFLLLVIIGGFVVYKSRFWK